DRLLPHAAGRAPALVEPAPVPQRGAGARLRRLPPGRGAAHAAAPGGRREPGRRRRVRPGRARAVPPRGGPEGPARGRRRGPLRPLRPPAVRRPGGRPAGGVLRAVPGGGGGRRAPGPGGGRSGRIGAARPQRTGALMSATSPTRLTVGVWLVVDGVLDNEVHRLIHDGHDLDASEVVRARGLRARGWELC